MAKVSEDNFLSGVITEPFSEGLLIGTEWLEYADIADETPLVESKKADFFAVDDNKALLWPAAKVKQQKIAHKLNNLRSVMAED